MNAGGSSSGAGGEAGGAEKVDSQLASRLPWQGQQWQHLISLQSDNRLPHALLLGGPSGIGKRQFALALAQYIMCERPVSGTACGECRQCGFNRAGTHPDLKLVAPEERGRQIRIDQVRDVVEFLGHTAQQGGYKVTIIRPAEAMNINAANALLKSLEEPAGNTLLILIADSPSLLLATIRSRCQIVTFPLPERERALAWLGTVLGADNQQQAETLLAEAQGQPLAALELLHGDGLSRLSQFDGDFAAMLAGQQSPLGVAERWQEFELADILDWLGRRLAQSIAGAVAGAQMQDPWAGVARRCDPRSLYSVLDAVNLLKRQLGQGGNPNRQLALENLLLISCDKFHI